VAADAEEAARMAVQTGAHVVGPGEGGNLLPCPRRSRRSGRWGIVRPYPLIRSRSTYRLDRLCRHVPAI
jgi:hypothetical protein